MGSWNAINRAGSVMGHEWSDLVCGVLSDGYWTLEQGTGMKLRRMCLPWDAAGRYLG